MKTKIPHYFFSVIVLLFLTVAANASVEVPNGKQQKMKAEIKEVNSKKGKRYYECYTLGVNICGMCVDFYMCGSWAEVMMNYQNLMVIADLAICPEDQ